MAQGWLNEATAFKTEASLSDREDRNLPWVCRIPPFRLELSGDAEGDSDHDRLRLADNCDLGCPIFRPNTREANPTHSKRTSKQDWWQEIWSLYSLARDGSTG